MISSLLLAVVSVAAALPCPDPARLTRGITAPLATVRYLADDALEGRLAGSTGERCAGDYIAARFRQLGLKPGAGTSFFQDVPLASVLSPHAQGTGRNVIAVLRGSDPMLREEWIVIGAHYDHLGRGALGSTAVGDEKNAIHNGADDNASGVAVVLEAARALVRAKPKRSIAFIAFSGEESGLLGSAHFAANPTVPFTRLQAMLNLDMVGRLGSGTLIVNGTGTATEWDRIIAAAANAEQVPFAGSREGTGPSDHTSFYLKDIPVLHFFSNTHSDYHKPSDDWQKIDSAGLGKIARIVTRIATAVADSPQPPTLVRGMGRPPAPVGAARGSGAYLGTVPDFTPVARGVLLGGVTAGSPADKAGIRAKDIIIRFDDGDIADLQGMTDALNKRKPGDTVKITVLRDGQEVVLTAVLGSRGGGVYPATNRYTVPFAESRYISPAESSPNERMLPTDPSDHCFSSET